MNTQIYLLQLVAIIMHLDKFSLFFFTNKDYDKGTKLLLFIFLFFIFLLFSCCRNRRSGLRFLLFLYIPAFSGKTTKERPNWDLSYGLFVGRFLTPPYEGIPNGAIN